VSEEREKTAETLCIKVRDGQESLKEGRRLSGAKQAAAPGKSIGIDTSRDHHEQRAFKLLDRVEETLVNGGIVPSAL